MSSKKLHLTWILPAAAVVAVVLALRPGAFSFSTLLLALVCPAMMFFMMRGMHHGAGDQSQGHQGCREHEEHPDDAGVMPK